MSNSADTEPVCHRCVMDLSDPTVSFDSAGVCNYCHEFDEVWKPKWHPGSDGLPLLEQLLSSLDRETKDDEYQVVLGLSGGLDSSYLMLLAKEWGLRVLAVHVDAGWDTPEAVQNIEALVQWSGFPYIVVTPEWETIRRLQLACLRSGIKNQDIPQDHAFFAGLYGVAHKHHVRHVLSGGNIATEAVVSKAWGESAMDSWMLRDIALRDRMYRFTGYPLIGFLEYFVLNPFVRKMKVLTPLNLVPYGRGLAMGNLRKIDGFTDYGNKHYESYFTRYYQGFYMPRRFGIDKRRVHLSNEINSGELTREAALQILDSPPITDEQRHADEEIIAERLEISIAELSDFSNPSFGKPPRLLSQMPLRRLFKQLQLGLERRSGRSLGRYT